MVRVADYIAKYIHDTLCINHVFMVPGGGSMFLNDALGHHEGLNYVCTHHEQSAAMAASAYSRYNDSMGVCCVTTGCGGTNALTGVLGAYQDFVPMLVISGQSKRKESIAFTHQSHLRQLGVQEANIIPIVEPITVYATSVHNPNLIKFQLDTAIYTAQTQHGPVWLDIPLDVQAAEIDESKLESYPFIQCHLPDSLNLLKAEQLINQSKRPIIIVGHGVRLAHEVPEFKAFIEKHNIPVVFSQGGIDVLPSDHPLNIGKIGTKGSRSGNFAVQNADLVLSIGSRLSVSSTGQEYELFAREAKKIAVDVHPEQHEKSTVKLDVIVAMDAKDFIEAFHIHPQTDVNWVKTCQHWKLTLQVYKKEPYHLDINLYQFIDALSSVLPQNSTIVADAGSAMFVTSQALRFKEGDRVILSHAQAEMGFTLPACIGAAFASNHSVIGITGDGSLQMNIQELQTIKHHNLPIKLFIWNNGGYLSMRNTQQNFFGRLSGADETSGVSFPYLFKIAEAYDIPYHAIYGDKMCQKAMPHIITRSLSEAGPIITEVFCLKNQDILTVKSKTLPNGSLLSMPLEDMYPYISREEFNREMIIKPLECSIK